MEVNPHRKNTIKTILAATLILLLLVFGAVASLPSIISSDWGSETILALVNKKIPGQIKIDSIDINWFKGQSLKNLRLLDKKGRVIASIKELSTDTSLFGLLRKKIGKTTISTPILDLVINADGKINLHSAIISSLKENGEDNRPKSATPLPFISEFELANGNISFTYQKGKPISFNNITAYLNPSTKKNKIDLKLNCATKHGNLLGKLKVETGIENISKINLLIEAEKLPVKGIDHIIHLLKLNSKISLSKTIGESLDFFCKSLIAKNDVSLNCFATARNLEINVKGLTKNGTFNLEKPGIVKCKIPAAIANEFLSKYSINLKEDSPCLLSMQQIAIPLSDYALSFIKATLSVGELPLEIPLLKEIVARKFDAFLEGPIKEIGLTTKLEIDQEDKNGLLLQYLGSPLVADIRGAFAKSFQLVLNSQLMQMQIDKMLVDNKAITIPNNISLDYLIDRTLIRKIPSKQIKDILANSQIPLKISIDPLTVKFADYQNTHCSGLLRAETFAIGSSSSIYDSKMSFDIKNPVASLDLTAHASTFRPTENGTVKISAKLSDFINLKDLKTDIKTIDFPLAIFEKKEESLTPLIGEKLNLEATGNFPSLNKGVLSLIAKTSIIDVSSKLRLNENTIETGKQKTIVNWKITPAGFLTLREKRDLTLQQPSNLKLEIEKLRFDRTTKDIALKMGSYIDEFDLSSDQGSHSTLIEDVYAIVDSKSIRKSIDFQLKGQVNQPISLQPISFEAKQNIPPGFSIVGNVDNLFDKENKLSISQISTKLSGMLSLPTQDLIYLLVKNPDVQQQLFALLGDQLSGQISANLTEMSGPINADLVSSHSRATISSNIQNKTLFLQKPIQADLLVTPELGEALKNFNPILSSPISADEPVELSIDSEGFSVPLFPFKMAGVNVGQARLDIGKIVLKNEGILNSLLDFFHSNAKEDFLAQDQINGWFTPLIAECKQGKASYSRIDALLDDIHIASWGDVDLANDRCNMTIGIGAETLKESFNIENVYPDYLLQIPITGKISNPKLDTAKALINLGTLEARQHGGAGFLFGELIDVITSKARNETPVPPPLIQPFPWEEGQ